MANWEEEWCWDGWLAGQHHETEELAPCEDDWGVVSQLNDTKESRMKARRGKKPADELAELEECILQEKAIALLAHIRANTNTLARILKEEHLSR